jgi:hypothetical protein
MPETQNKATFNLKRKANEVTDSKGNVLVLSIQEIVQSDDRKSEHLVITKFRRNVDGSQAGLSKSLFLPLALVPKLLETAKALIR